MGAITAKKRASLAIILIAALTMVFTMMSMPSTAQETFNDISDQPEEIRRAIEYCYERGYMEGFPDGGFHPGDPTSRIDCARALVLLFGYGEEEVDPAVGFPDLPPEDPDFKWANLAVKKGLMDTHPDGSFAPREPVAFERVVIGVTEGLGLGDTAACINTLTGGDPYYGGAMVVFMDLHLKYRYSGVWPGNGYPRGEMAFSLYRLDHLDEWRIYYLRETFTADRCVPPEGDEAQLEAVRYGFERLGCPYVYGGESEAEGGFDCSGFVYNTLSMRMGYPMMRVADDQARDSRYLFVSREALEPGDAVFFYGEEYGNPSCYINHAGMYVGNGIFVHSTGSNAGVSFDCLDTNGYWGTHFAWGRRVVGGPYYDRFDTYLLLFNPWEEDLPVQVRYLRPEGEPEAREYVLAAHSRYTVPVDLIFPWDEVSCEVLAPAPGVVAERAMYFDYGGWADGGHASTGTGETSQEGYFAEGYTGEGFHTWLLLANPGPERAEVEVVYLREGTGPLVRRYFIEPSTRCTIFVNQVKDLEPGNVGISYRVLSGPGVVAERAMYFLYRGGIAGGHCSPAVTRPSTRLYLAEGYTGGSFDTWILLANPAGEDAGVRVDFLLQGGDVVRKEVTVPAYSRLTVEASEVVGEASFGVELESLDGVGIVAERAMYFRYGDGVEGGHCSPAVTRPSTRLYLAEGYTGGSFDTWILLANPGDDDAAVTLVFCREDGSRVERQVSVPPHARFTVKANEIPGLEGCSFSVLVESDVPVLAERSMYFFYEDRSGGTNCPAQEEPREGSFFAEGYTGG